MQENLSRAWPPDDVLPIIAIVRLTSDSSLEAVEALRAGGVDLVEITLTTPGALAAIRDLTQRYPDAWIGAGSVVTIAEAEDAIGVGAKFLVTPVVDEAVLELARTHGVPVVCGAYTPTELQSAHAHGAALVKVFPASKLGPGYLRDVLAPLPHLRLAPTGGVTIANLPEWFAAGAVAVALGSDLVSQEDARTGAWRQVSERAAAASGAAQVALRGRAPR